MISLLSIKSPNATRTTRTSILHPPSIPAPNSLRVFNMISTFAFISSMPASGLVDDRLAGEGTGKALGVNDPVLGWVILAMFTLIWALYYTATKELGGQSEDDGLGL